MKTVNKTARPFIIGSFEITLGGQSVSYTLKRSLRARLVWLLIRPDTGLIVTVPRRYNLDELADYLISKTSWILRHLSNLSGGLPPPTEMTGLHPPICFQGLALPACGENHHKTYVLPDGTTGDHSAALDWLKQRARAVIPSKVQQYSPQIGVRFAKISIRDQKTRWGSCSRIGNLNFNWRLIMAPEPVLDYVVIHELCHLKRMSHGKSFWDIVAKYCPDWQEKRRWLNKHSRELHYFHSSSA